MDNSNTEVEIKDIQMEMLKKRIPYNENLHKDTTNYENVLESLLEDSKYIGLSLKFPYDDYSNMELPSKYKNWQIRCCLELYKLAGNENIKSYSENGLNWTLFKSGLSIDLINEIVPKVGIPKVESDDANV